ncbi:MAG: RNA ligase family protein [Candidatus Omnitrophica bacterium]|nr:RNA ligase family protein [Candidatus Omnitrophota bacterium]
MEKYNKILTLGDRAIPDILESDCVIEEKIDGSQFRFGIDAEGKRTFGSKEVEYSDERPPDKMFKAAVDTAEGLLNYVPLDVKNILFVCEYLTKKKHNTIEYARVPAKSLILLDVLRDGAPDRELRKLYATIFELETPQILGNGRNLSVSVLEDLLKTDSMLGNSKIEGVVIKNYEKRFISHNKSYPYFAKFVREDFKEENKKNWGQGIPLEAQILGDYPQAPRWQKALQHLRERGELENTPRDIPKLCEELSRDFEEETKEAIKERLYQKFRHGLLAGMRRGLAEWYKEELAKKVLEK